MSIPHTLLFDDLTLGPFACRIAVPESGYVVNGRLALDPARVLGEVHEDGPWLVEPHDVPENRQVRQYSPFRHTGLHRRFAHIPSTEPAIAAFASSYGLLGAARHVYDPSKQTQTERTGESIQYWRREIAYMRCMLEILDMVRDRQSGPLGQLVVWNADPPSVSIHLAGTTAGLLPALARAVRRESDPERRRELLLAARARAPWHQGFLTMKQIAHADLGTADRELLDRWSFGDPIEPARYFVYREVNKQLDGRVHPAVLPYRSGDVFFFADGLLGALYAMFAAELSGRLLAPTQCKGCGEYFNPSSRRQKYCEDRCRKLTWWHKEKGA